MADGSTATRPVDSDAESVEAEVEELIARAWDPSITVAEWWRVLAEARLSSPTLPENAGGRGYSRALAGVVSRVMAEREVLGPPGGLGRMLAAPTIAAHGTQHQIDAWIPEILEGRVGWCQLFSEPNAGSDLAGLQCRAERDGDEWVISGQKVWTSGGQVADWGMLLARTDPDAPKHRGISWFAFPMDQPGVEVRPLREMTGRALFNEVFIDGARVADANVIGGHDNGWAVANTTLMVERASLGSTGPQPAGAVPGPKGGILDRRARDFAVRKASEGGVPSLNLDLWWHLVEMARANGRIDDPVLRDRLARLYTLICINGLSARRGRSESQRTGAEGNIAKLVMSELFRSFREIGVSVIGPDAMLLGPDDASSDGVIGEIALFSPGPSIYGGTDEVQRNIIGERVLGLPKEPGPDKTTPFSELLKN